MNARRLISILSFTILSLTSTVPFAAEPLRVFIRAGVKTHGPGQHDHPRFLQDWVPLLKARGVQASGSMTFPTAEQLQNTDVVVVFAADGMAFRGENRAEFEKFLQRGGGLVVVHDGVVSAAEHEWAKKVQGGAWIWARNAPEKTATKWLESTVGLYVVDTEHPITRGLSNFDWKDEIYYDMDMSPDVRVLATSFHSVFIIAPQLWTYEKTWEGGSKPYRAFVSLPGHEYVSFNTPHYRAILMRGIAWAGRRENVDELCVPEELASLKYPEGGPTAPEKAAAKLNVHPDFNASLVASEPLVEKVMSLDWDAQGRLWVAETPEYPGGRTAHRNDAPAFPYRGREPEKFATGKEPRPARDRISWLEDTNGDGRMDSKHVFADFEHGVPGGLERVTSLVFYKDGVIVAQAPDILWLRDMNNDGVADRVEKLYTGFGINDTHAVINNFRWGLDGWIYSAIGYSAGRPTSSDGAKDFGRVTAGIIRFKPDGSALEQVASGSCNTWGFDIGPDGELFYTTATCDQHFLHIVMPEKVLARGSVEGVRASAVLPDHQSVFPAVKHTRPAYVQIDLVGRFTAAAGCCIYNGGAWPEKFNGSQFLSEPTVNLVHNEFLTPKGATYVASKETGREQTEFIAGSDLWFRPIHTRIGPDGALYVVDFYNQAAIHNDTRGPNHGAHNAATRPDRDHHFARIWRVQHKEAKMLLPWKFAANDDAGLTRQLEHPNGWVRATAHRLLLERGADLAGQPVTALARNGRDGTARMHALYALNNAGKLENAMLVTAVNDADPIVRKNALRIAADKPSTPRETATAIQSRLNDSDPRVKIQALTALGTFDSTPEIARAIVNVWPSLADQWIQSAAIGVAAKDPILFVEAALSPNAAATLDPFVRHTVRQLALKGDPSAVARLVAMLSQAPARVDAYKQAALESLVANLRTEVVLEWNAALQAAFKSLLAAANPAVPGAALPLIGRWDKSGSLSADLKPVIARVAAQLTDASLSDDARGQVAVNLLGVRQMDSNVVAAVAMLLNPGGSIVLQRRVVEALGNINEAATGQALLNAFAKSTTELKDAIFAQLVRRPEWARSLVQALADKRVLLATLGPASTHRLRTHPDNDVAQFASDTIQALRGPEAKQKEALVAKLKPEIEKAGNIENGKKLYTANCANCHVFKNEGRNLAPNLTGMGAHGAAELLVHLVDPNRLVEPNFLSWSVETKTGETFDGIIESENSRELVLRNAGGDYTIQQQDVKNRRSTGLSLMPEGFDSLGAEGLRDMLAYICADDEKHRFIDLRAVATADSTQGIYATRERRNESLLFRNFGIVKVGDVPFEIAHPNKTLNGNNLIVLQARNGMARGYPKRVEISDLNLKARRLHFLGGVGGWAWPFGGDEAKGLPASTITVTFADGSTNSWTLTNGVHVADYNTPTDVPGSKAAPGLVTRGQVRTFSRDVKNNSPITKIALESAGTTVATTYVAITAELVPAAVASANPR